MSKGCLCNNMFAIFDGEKYFPDAGTDFDIILDVAPKFKLTTIANCTIFDILQAYWYKKKFASRTSIIKILWPQKIHWLSKNDLQIQEIDVMNLDTSRNVIFLETIIAHLCANKVAHNQWWMYITQNTKLRIIAGLGKAIYVSRIIASDCNADVEISRTTTYLKRFGVNEESIKIFQSTNACNDIMELFDKKFDDVNDAILNACEKIPPDILKKDRYYLPACALLNFCSCCLLCIGIALFYHNEAQIIPPIPSIISNGCITLRVNDDLNVIENFVDRISKRMLPWEDIKKIHTQFPDIDISKLSMNADEIKIITPDSSQCIKK